MSWCGTDTWDCLSLLLSHRRRAFPRQVRRYASPAARGVALAHSAFRPPSIFIIVIAESAASGRNELGRFSAGASQRPFKDDPVPPPAVVPSRSGFQTARQNAVDVIKADPVGKRRRSNDRGLESFISAGRRREPAPCVYSDRRNGNNKK